MAPSRSKQTKRELRRLDAQLLSDLWVFRAVARAGSMSAAAAQLNVTAGAVSQRVLRLEARLKEQLFQRDKGKIALTSSGGIVLDAMNGVFTTLSNALSRLRHTRHDRIVVSCAPSLAMEWLMPHLLEFYRECPDVELTVRSEMSLPTAEWMKTEGVDVVITHNRARPADLIELGSLQELTFPVCSRAYRDHLRAQPTEERFVIALHDDVPWCEGEPLRAEWQEWLAGAGRSCEFAINTDRHFNLASLAYQAAIHGQGMAIGRSVLVNSLLETGSLVPGGYVPPVPSAYYRVLSPTKEAADSRCSRFAAWLIEGLARTQKETLTMLATDP
jgi:LysR family glycine cleavage system transcriptional activator